MINFTGSTRLSKHKYIKVIYTDIYICVCVCVVQFTTKGAAKCKRKVVEK